MDSVVFFKLATILKDYTIFLFPGIILYKFFIVATAKQVNSFLLLICFCRVKKLIKETATCVLHSNLTFEIHNKDSAWRWKTNFPDLYYNPFNFAPWERLQRPSNKHLEYLIRTIRTQLFSWKLTKSLYLNVLIDIHWIIIVLIWRNNYGQTFSICCLLERSGWLFNHASLIIVCQPLSLRS